jgi:hypothetical protein
MDFSVPSPCSQWLCGEFDKIHHRGTEGTEDAQRGFN